MAFTIRKLVTHKETTLIEGDKGVDIPVTMTGVAAVVKNPWHGRGFIEDLRPEQLDGCSELGRVLVEQMLKEIDSVDSIEAYGKAAVVGADGEIEHASAMIHNLRFGNHYRNAMKAESFLAFTNIRGGMNCSIQVPMKHLHEISARSHFITMEFSISDAPRADEVVVVLGASTGGRAHPRIGDRNMDMVELEQEAQA
ncbi:amino acid synthesis family protein [Aliamphritea hakodatensis]|uniref:amino acid synthesis family protein n=1 Tax=Aliamphritea hakodatensis TaxID=2895352 RepID=UPI0022FDABA9|nr:amino acid synthesis family protein [Aliamphritea hakodatensis]